MAMNTEDSLREYLRVVARVPLVGRIGPLARTFDFVADAAPGVKEILAIGKLCWEVRERLESPARTRFGLMPVTGRSHQLRVHLLAIGHPILGDDLYAPPEVKAMSPRLCLHAERLGFTHPATGASMDFSAPADF